MHISRCGTKKSFCPTSVPNRHFRLRSRCCKNSSVKHVPLDWDSPFCRNGLLRLERLGDGKIRQAEGPATIVNDDTELKCTHYNNGPIGKYRVKSTPVPYLNACRSAVPDVIPIDFSIVWMFFSKEIRGTV